MIMKCIRTQGKLFAFTLLIVMTATLVVSCSNGNDTTNNKTTSALEKSDSVNITANIVTKENGSNAKASDKENDIQKKIQRLLDFEKQMKECVDTGDLDKLFSLSNGITLDGAYSEGYADSLYKLYKKGGVKTFINKLSKLNPSKTDEFIFLVVSDLHPEHVSDEVNEFEKEFEKLKSDSSLTPKEIYIVYETLAKIKYFKGYL